MTISNWLRCIGVVCCTGLAGCPEQRVALLKEGSREGSITIEFGREDRHRSAITFGVLRAYRCAGGTRSYREVLVWDIQSLGKPIELEEVTIGLVPQGLVQTTRGDLSSPGCLHIESGIAAVTLDIRTDGSVVVLAQSGKD